MTDQRMNADISSSELGRPALTSMAAQTALLNQNQLKFNDSTLARFKRLERTLLLVAITAGVEGISFACLAIYVADHIR